MSFDWQTEEDRDSEQADQWLPEPRLRPGRRRLWILLPLALVVAAIIIAGRQVNERIEDATALVREDILSSHALARQAVAQQDEELLVSILSGHGGRWRDVQQERLRIGLLFEDASRPLEFIPLPGPAQNVDVLLNPELSEAVVQEVQPFTVDDHGSPHPNARLSSGGSALVVVAARRRFLGRLADARRRPAHDGRAGKGSETGREASTGH